MPQLERRATARAAPVAPLHAPHLPRRRHGSYRRRLYMAAVAAPMLQEVLDLLPPLLPAPVAAVAAGVAPLQAPLARLHPPAQPALAAPQTMTESCTYERRIVVAVN
jgi:hypothetical protein